MISTPLDWYGINCYAPTRIGAPAGQSDTGATDGPELPPQLPFGSMPSRATR